MTKEGPAKKTERALRVAQAIDSQYSENSAFGSQFGRVRTAAGRPAQRPVEHSGPISSQASKQAQSSSFLSQCGDPLVREPAANLLSDEELARHCSPPTTGSSSSSCPVRRKRLKTLPLYGSGRYASVDSVPEAPVVTSLKRPSLRKGSSLDGLESPFSTSAPGKAIMHQKTTEDKFQLSICGSPVPCLPPPLPIAEANERPWISDQWRVADSDRGRSQHRTWVLDAHGHTVLNKDSADFRSD